MSHPALDALRDRLPDEARDVRLNLDAVMTSESLSEQQRFMVALASAIASGDETVVRLVQDAALAACSRESVEDARAAAILMAMNNTYYRFKHWMTKEPYASQPARLRMNRIGRPATSRADFELACLAVSAINGCEACVKAHEETVTAHGLGAEAVNDAIRIAATIRAAAAGLLASRVPAPPAS